MTTGPELNTLNDTELAYTIRSRTGVVVKRSVGKARLIQLVQTGEMPLPEEIAPSTATRSKLQLYIEKNWSGINSQLPCKGENRGKCTIYPCPEGRHADCLLAAAPHMKLHDL